MWLPPKQTFHNYVVRALPSFGVTGRGMSPFSPTENPYSPILLITKTIKPYQLIPSNPIFTKHRNDNSY